MGEAPGESGNGAPDLAKAANWVSQLAGELPCSVAKSGQTVRELAKAPAELTKRAITLTKAMAGLAKSAKVFTGERCQ